MQSQSSSDYNWKNSVLFQKIFLYALFSICDFQMRFFHCLAIIFFLNCCSGVIYLGSKHYIVSIILFTQTPVRGFCRLHLFWPSYNTSFLYVMFLKYCTEKLDYPWKTRLENIWFLGKGLWVYLEGSMCSRSTWGLAKHMPLVS